MRVYCGDCLDILKEMNSNSIGSIVTDPPYGLSIMNQKWDQSMPNEEVWQECFRVLKPGGYILSFASARLYQHLALVMEKVGFQTQNMLAWLYGNGFPRGVNLSKELDKSEFWPKPDAHFRVYLRKAIQKSSYTIKELEAICGSTNMFSHYLGKAQAQFPSYEKWKILKRVLRLDNTYDGLYKKLEKLRKEYSLSLGEKKKTKHFKNLSRDFKRHQPCSKIAQKWEGWQYGKMTLKPCIEPIYFGQKPTVGTVGENVKKYGVGALNTRACRLRGRDGKERFPGSVMHDGSKEVVSQLEHYSENAPFSFGEFLYVPKPTGRIRKLNPHPTLKPLDLMRHLARLVTPLEGVCLDPFMGSGTTGEACLKENLDFIGIEKERTYFQIAKKRLRRAL